MKRYDKYIKTFMVISIVVVFLAFLNLVLSQYYVSITTYGYKNSKINQDFKIAQLTDLHNYQFGSQNCRLLKKVAKQKPDVIFLTGDMLNGDEERRDIFIELIEKLVQIAPVYASLGNHEIEYMERYKTTNLIAEMEQAGATVLEKEYLDIEINGQEIRLGGIYGYVLPGERGDGSEKRFMEEFQDTDRFKILLSHIPEGLLLWKSMEHWNVDLVFSGHVHGGQVRLPFIGGLFDPEEGYFPTYTKGMFSCGHGTMILSAGLGSSRGIPRINNLPELVVCDITRR